MLTETYHNYKPTCTRPRRERNLLFNDSLDTFYLWLYDVGRMVRDNTNVKNENPLPQHHELLFPRYLLYTARDLVYSLSQRQDSSYHGQRHASGGELLERETAQWIDHEESIPPSIASWPDSLPSCLSFQRSEMQLRGKSVRSWCDWLSDLSFIGEPTTQCLVPSIAPRLV